MVRATTTVAVAMLTLSAERALAGPPADLYQDWFAISVSPRPEPELRAALRRHLHSAFRRCSIECQIGVVGATASPL
jgi:hypothetical protein